MLTSQKIDSAPGLIVLRSRRAIGYEGDSYGDLDYRVGGEG